ncbi:MAG: ABC transporter ATP-binding protein [Deltaproteobacteria bacterium]|nr:ABC transporter ATP-binding protein [Deltaproteobacteria bacterium]
MIEARNITHCYQEEAALSDVSLRVNAGEFLAVTGTSGSGKSTLLAILSTLLQPTSGEVLLNGTRIASIKNLDPLRRKEIGFVFQFHYLINYLTLSENIKLAGVNSSIAEIDSLLDSLDILELKDCYPNQISGGQRQRAAIARALINRPSILFADEPTGNLDSKNSARVYEIFRKLCDQGSTLVLATHDQRIAKIADRSIEVQDGRLL